MTEQQPSDAAAERDAYLDTHPGPQQRLRRSRVPILATAMLVVTCLLLLHGLVVRNRDLLNAETWPMGGSLWSFESISPDTLATIAVVIVVALLGWIQYAATQRPWLNVQAGFVTESSDGLDRPPGVGRLLRTTLDNDGAGVADVSSASYSVESVDGCVAAFAHHDDVVVHLAKLGMVHERNCYLGFFVPGTSLRPGASKGIWEMWDVPPGTLRRLDITFQFRSQSGERFSKTAFLIPTRDQERYASRRSSEDSS